MKQFQYNKVLIAFIFVGLVAALLIDVARWRAEEVNKQVDLAIDYEDLVQLAEQEGKPVPEVLQAAKEAGITSLAVYETTFKKFNVNGKAARSKAPMFALSDTTRVPTRRSRRTCCAAWALLV